LTEIKGSLNYRMLATAKFRIL